MSENGSRMLESAQKGSVASFEELTEPYRVGIYNLMLKTCGDEFAASQLTQDVFVKVFEALLSGSPARDLAGLIYRTAGEISRSAACKSRMIS